MAALQKTPIAAVAIAAVASLVGIGGFSPNAHAACTPSGTTLNCTGNITGDLFFDGFQDTSGSYTTYNFFDITDPVPIQPQFDSGIYIQSPTHAPPPRVHTHPATPPTRQHHPVPYIHLTPATTTPRPPSTPTHPDTPTTLPTHQHPSPTHTYPTPNTTTHTPLSHHITT